MSVPEAVRRIVAGNRTIHDCVRMDIVNYTALAARIRPEVEGLVGGPVNLNTVVVAVKRYADSFERTRDLRREPLLKDARLSLIDGIMDIRISTDALDSDAVASLIGKFSHSSSDYDLFRMAGTIRLLAEDTEDVKGMLGPLLLDSNPPGTRLVKIRITVPAGGKNSDIVSYVTEILHYAGIELVNAFFDRDNMILILNEGDAPRAYGILRSRAA